MHTHRLAPSASLRVQCIDRPFSNFDHVDASFGNVPSIRRLFSQARSYGCRTLVTEVIRPLGIVAEDDAELAVLFPDFSRGGLLRLSFWKRKFDSAEQVAGLSSRHLVGYAILKRDVVPSRAQCNWYVFESVFIKYPHAHNCVRGMLRYPVRVGEKSFTVKGVLYCQQNGLNKACAQVALRSLCAGFVTGRDISYATINRFAADAGEPVEPWSGLSVPQIRAVLTGLNISFRDIDYAKEKPNGQWPPPYQKLLYAGAESGAGALLGFRFTGAGVQQDATHIIPFFGHTFNQDTWAPNAEAAYFHIGETTRYLPSEDWVSSFIGHDDNFGSNFCVPRLYVTAKQAEYAVELLPPRVAYSGMIAEAVAVDYLYSILPALTGSALPWLDRLIAYVAEQKVVLRAVSLTKREYVVHWQKMKDWSGQSEDAALCKVMDRHLPDRLWMVEVSVPELFPANLRKVGEIVLTAMSPPTSQRDFRLFWFARVPGRLVFIKAVDAAGQPTFAFVPSQLESHTALYGCGQRQRRTAGVP